MAKPNTVNRITVRGRYKTQQEQVADTEKWICRDIARAYHEASMPLPQSVIERCMRAGVEVENA